jgi:hypothetical protein
MRDPQGDLDAANEVIRVLLERNEGLAVAVREIQKLAGAARVHGSSFDALIEIEQRCEDVLWTPTTLGRDEGAGW